MQIIWDVPNKKDFDSFKKKIASKQDKESAKRKRRNGNDVPNEQLFQQTKWAHSNEYQIKQKRRKIYFDVLQLFFPLLFVILNIVLFNYTNEKTN